MKRLNVSLMCLIAGFYAPATAHAENGVASVYGNFDGQQYSKTSNGERVYPRLATCAHRTAPMHTILHIKNTKNGLQADCRVNDRGPFKQGRIVDVTPVVAANLGFTGLASVSITYGR